MTPRSLSDPAVLGSEFVTSTWLPFGQTWQRKSSPKISLDDFPIEMPIEIMVYYVPRKLQARHLQPPDARDHCSGIGTCPTLSIFHGAKHLLWEQHRLTNHESTFVEITSISIHGQIMPTPATPWATYSNND